MKYFFKGSKVEVVHVEHKPRDPGEVDAEDLLRQNKSPNVRRLYDLAQKELRSSAQCSAETAKRAIERARDLKRDSGMWPVLKAANE